MEERMMKILEELVDNQQKLIAVLNNESAQKDLIIDALNGMVRLQEKAINSDVKTILEMLKNMRVRS